MRNWHPHEFIAPRELCYCILKRDNPAHPALFCPRVRCCRQLSSTGAGAAVVVATHLARTS
jgi:hypothetical protein